MTEPLSGLRNVTYLGVIAGLIGVLIWVSGADAKSSSAPPSAAAKVAACDYHTHPIITLVKPNRAKPGQKITEELGSDARSKRAHRSLAPTCDGMVDRRTFPWSS